MSNNVFGASLFKPTGEVELKSVHTTPNGTRVRFSLGSRILGLNLSQAELKGLQEMQELMDAKVKANPDSNEPIVTKYEFL